MNTPQFRATILRIQELHISAESAITIFSDDAVFYVNDTKMTPKEVV
jgi:hypothetical protein